jgi:hypothetical protein
MLDTIHDCIIGQNTEDASWRFALDVVARNMLPINTKSTCGATLLYTACQTGNVDVIRELLRLHADPNIDNGCQLPMHALMRCDIKPAQRAEVCALLPAKHLAVRNHFFHETPLQLFLTHALCTDLEFLAWCCTQPQCDLIVLDRFGRTPLDIMRLRKAWCQGVWRYCQGEWQHWIEIVEDAVAARKRWTAPRAAWCAACVLVL